MNPIIGVLTAAVLTLGAVTAAPADTVEKDGLTIAEPAARPNLPNRPTAAYMAITNARAEADRLIAASSPAFGKIEIHRSSMQDGVMNMEMIEAIEIPANGSVMLEPGGLHLMLFDGAEPLKDGADFPMTLTFEKAGDVAVTVSVDKRIGGGHGGHGDHGKKKHSH